MKAQLVCRLRPGLIQTFDLSGEETVLGRDATIAVPIPREGVSRRHARIVLEGSAHWIEDLKSTNGTFVNGQAVKKEKLYDLDVVSLGREADLVFVLRPEGPLVIKTTGIVRGALVPEGADAPPHEIGAGEATLGRSAACTIVAESGAVSKFHARITRTVSQLQLEDLGSSNGTFVNGERVKAAVLQDGDLLSLAGVEVFRVVIERGEITSSSGARPAPELAAPATMAEGSRRFSANWKTRFEWDSAEYRMLEQLRQPDREKATPPEATVLRPSKAPARAATPAPPGPKAAPKPVAAPTPVPPPRPEAPKPAPPAAPPEKPPAPTSQPAPPPPAVATKAPSVPPAAPAEAAQAPPIAEVRLTAPGIDLVATATGSHEMGRASTAALRVDHPTVSRRHARIIISDDRTIAYVQDRGGANGTRLNRVLLEELKVLSDGDVIGVGEVELQVTILRR